MGAPIQVKNPWPDVPAWREEASLWVDLNAAAGGNADFEPLTVKLGYVMGVAYEIFLTVGILTRSTFWPATYLSAFAMFASGADLLGRCIEGDSNRDGNATRNLKTGLSWMTEARPIATSTGVYDVAALAALRHFGAHGQATARVDSGLCIDVELLPLLKDPFIGGVARYWHEVVHVSDEFCARLALAKVDPFRDGPVTTIWKLLDGDPIGSHPPLEEIFGRHAWRPPSDG